MITNQSAKSATAKPVVYEANAYYAKAAEYAFTFIKAEHKESKLVTEREQIETQHDTKSNFWRVASFVAITIAVGLGFFEAYNIQTSLSGIFNSGETEQISPSLLYFLGFTFASIGLLLGHSLNAETDHVTGRKKRTTKWWVCFVLSFAYVYAQYHLANMAGIGTDDNAKQMVSSQSLFVVFIAVAELLLGYLFLHTAIEYLFSFRLKLLFAWQRFKMNFSAKRCDQNWDYYIGYLQDFNFNNPYNLLEEKEETENIHSARLYYKNTSGYGLS